jgi:Putative 2OG-Fe(II) oxygenase
MTQSASQKRSEISLESFAQALRLTLSGEHDEGLALYRRCLNKFGREIPVGWHVKFLENAGKHDSATALVNLALNYAGNLSLNQFRLDSPISKIVAEYESLFETGIINSSMVYEYLLRLNDCEKFSNISNILQPDKLVSKTYLQDIKSDFVSRLILDNIDLADFQDSVQSVRNMHKLNLSKIALMEHEIFQELLNSFMQQVNIYKSNYKSIDSKISNWFPEDPYIDAWALVSYGDGFNVPHYHGRGWVTGVYYASIDPEGEKAGALRIGPPECVSTGTAAWPDITIEPTPGLLVLMPSYYTHWTEPLGRPGLRISIAFDVLDRQNQTGLA